MMYRYIGMEGEFLSQEEEYYVSKGEAYVPYEDHCNDLWVNVRGRAYMFETLDGEPVCEAFDKIEEVEEGDLDGFD